MKKPDPVQSQAVGPESIHLFFGEEFLVKEQVRKLIEELLEAQFRGTNLIVLDGSNLDAGELSSHLLTPSLFGGPRVVVVDQTTLFMGTADRDKLLQKTIAGWRSNDRKAALRNFGQLLGVTGLTVQDLSAGDDWIAEAFGDSLDAQETETLRSAALSFLDAGGKAGSVKDEAVVEGLISSPLPPETFLIFTAAGVDRRKRIFKVIEKRARVVECAARGERFGTGLDRSFFDERVDKAVSAAGKRISRAAREKIYALSGKDIRRLHSELDKLIGYVGERKEITVEDVVALFSDFHEAAFYEMNRALRTLDPAKSLAALHENLKIVDHPLQTLALIANEFRRLMVAREMLFTVFQPYWKPGITYEQFLPCAKRIREENPDHSAKGKINLLSVKDYALYQYLKDAQRFSMEMLTSIMEEILEADVMMKSTRLGGTSPGTIMEKLVIQICRMPRSRKS